MDLPDADTNGIHDVLVLAAEAGRNSDSSSSGTVSTSGMKDPRAFWTLRAE